MTDMNKIESLFTEICKHQKAISELINELYMEVYKEESTSDKFKFPDQGPCDVPNSEWTDPINVERDYNAFKGSNKR